MRDLWHKRFAHMFEFMILVEVLVTFLVLQQIADRCSIFVVLVGLYLSRKWIILIVFKGI